MCQNTYDLKDIDGTCFEMADVVLSSYRVQVQEGYNKTCLNSWLGRDTEAAKYIGKNTKGKIQALRIAVERWKEEGSVETMLAHKFPLFELFWWRRLVMDEFHESEAWSFRVRELLKGVGASSRWGLSGTPPVGSLDSIKQVAEVLGHDMPKACKREHAQKFLDQHVRQNASDFVESIRVVEHREVVRLTSAERLLYRQACRDLGIFDLQAGYQEASLEARARLLRLCAHFGEDGGGDKSAGDAVESVSKRKEQRIRDVEGQLALELARGGHLCAAWQGAKGLAEFAARLQNPQAKAFAEQLASVAGQAAAAVQGAEALRLRITHVNKKGEPLKEPKVELCQPLRPSEYCTDLKMRHRLKHAVARKQADLCTSNNILCRSTICREACKTRLEDVMSASLAQLVRLLDEAHTSLRFWEQQLRSVNIGASGSADRTCVICLEEDCSLSSLAILPCAHIFHLHCLKACLAANPACPHCRRPSALREVSQLQVEAEPTVVEDAMDDEDEGAPGSRLSAADRAHGSKLSAVARRLKRLRAEDPGARALVFVQWEGLESEVAKALQTHGVPVERLPRGSMQSGKVLSAFQAGKSSAFALVLSLEHCASGSNLTVASHVLFVHPMNAATVDQAVAWEKQALGRVRRVGQSRREVHVYRFVTRNTIDEHVTLLHQQEA